MRDLKFAWLVCKHVKSNAIVICKDGMLLGAGAGQMDRVSAARLAIAKAGERVRGAVAASDAFFPFPDGPPNTSHELNGWGDNLIHRELKAVMRGDRIALLYSNKDYSSEWSYHPENKRFYSVDNTRFGVNIVVYALTR